MKKQTATLTPPPPPPTATEMAAVLTAAQVDTVERVIESQRNQSRRAVETDSDQKAAVVAVAVVAVAVVAVAVSDRQL
jgi:hypothetical protein